MKQIRYFEKVRPGYILLILIAVATVFFVTDFNKYEVNTKNISCDNKGIIFAITAFNGESESDLLVKSLGHAWASIDNQTGHSIYINNNEIKDGEMISFSIWALSGRFGVVYNLEPSFAEKYGRYVGRKSLSMNIDEAKLAIIEEYINENNRWTLFTNCSHWSVDLWNELADNNKLKTPVFLYTPQRLQKAIGEYCTAETDMDFSRCGGAFLLENNNRKELKLCE